MKYQGLLIYIIPEKELNLALFIELICLRDQGYTGSEISVSVFLCLHLKYFL